MITNAGYLASLRLNPFLGLTVIALLMLIPELALATGTDAASTTTMPWEGPLQTIMQSITGPVAMVIALVGITIAGGMLIFGGELGEFGRRLVMLVLVMGLLLMAANVIGGLFTGTGAAI